MNLQWYFAQVGKINNASHFNASAVTKLKGKDKSKKKIH